MQNVDIERTETWTRFRKGLCEGCAARCCTLPVEARLADLVRLQLVDAFEAEHEEPVRIARRLQKSGAIERYHARNGVFTLARRASGDCIHLDAVTRRCTVYANRPTTCRNHPQVGPRPGYCPHGPAAAL
jgi:hypothetical protein